MLVMLLSALKDMFREVHPVRIFLEAEKELGQIQSMLNARVMKWYLSCSRGAIDEWRLQRLKALQMIAVNVAQEALQRRSSIRDSTEVVDLLCKQITTKNMPKETYFLYRETLEHNSV